MAENGHKDAFPTRDDIRDFLRTLKPDAPSMFLALGGAVSSGAVDKWYRKKGNEISSTNLLRVVIALGKIPEFAVWLASYSPVGETWNTAGTLAAISPEFEALLRKQARSQEQVSGGRKGR